MTLDKVPITMSEDLPEAKEQTWRNETNGETNLFKSPLGSSFTTLSPQTRSPSRAVAPLQSLRLQAARISPPQLPRSDVQNSHLENANNPAIIFSTATLQRLAFNWMLHDSFMIFIVHIVHACFTWFHWNVAKKNSFCSFLKNSGRRTVAITAIEIRGQHLSTWPTGPRIQDGNLHVESSNHVALLHLGRPWVCQGQTQFGQPECWFKFICKPHSAAPAVPLKVTVEITSNCSTKLIHQSYEWYPTTPLATTNLSRVIRVITPLENQDTNAWQLPQVFSLSTSGQRSKESQLISACPSCPSCPSP